MDIINVCIYIRHIKILFLLVCVLFVLNDIDHWGVMVASSYLGGFSVSATSSYLGGKSCLATSWPPASPSVAGAGLGSPITMKTTCMCLQADITSSISRRRKI